MSQDRPATDTKILGYRWYDPSGWPDDIDEPVIEIRIIFNPHIHDPVQLQWQLARVTAEMARALSKEAQRDR